MLKIRLSRQGKKNKPSYRLVVIDSKKPRQGEAIESLGFFNPISNELQVDLPRVEHWVRKGAQLTDTVSALIKKNK